MTTSFTGVHTAKHVCSISRFATWKLTYRYASSHEPRGFSTLAEVHTVRVLYCSCLYSYLCL
ncbi:hypothetical protein B0I72DRAFT_159547 [Yarrowia lipolytica]|uniref:YALI0A09515p n=2 Tax=Yarrowia lipolytica TaxID=4952 RepID=Q6CHF5_YARLI|nr:YALI0A09515p [Yarrowia lipolytica CLIB122]RDW23021.1 hypothetical protein B0I71DRAFT_89332 [Yarrowia lipolytica]RDW31680.1 hypothetical protein B0I72DRAFT_159547 [Yarrowia lipolytica]CAG83833.2 YALI0A09515p [Yarrowia lipolytica CLIB122]|eukprot:XP_499906.2 YALI0A09515p [Yarrowia lipolytica CLIB122]